MRTYNITQPFIVFITGASGAGKSTLTQSLAAESQNPANVFLHFDSIGVPSEQEMIAQYGSGSNWQKAMTLEWVHRILRDYHDKKRVIIEGQVNLDFIFAAFDEANITNYKVILIHCEHPQRHQRLQQERKQPELVNETMDHWSHVLKSQALAKGADIIDTSSHSIAKTLDILKRLLT